MQDINCKEIIGFILALPLLIFFIALLLGGLLFPIYLLFTKDYWLGIIMGTIMYGLIGLGLMENQ